MVAVSAEIQPYCPVFLSQMNSVELSGDFEASFTFRHRSRCRSNSASRIIAFPPRGRLGA